ncbi:dephospho-CoA kinase [Desulfobotulus sp.]|uniref:dephospho-CoA kinase n=1 Tax=Desulfobotulus sp. TaxID=1940337 RepID=UPI002A364989|nr:dephospho-CoA kinase [Desulfobotulus sp.]MDY0162310.1 dephospho-CoA kinase [Desulfobotulus sp.]
MLRLPGRADGIRVWKHTGLVDGFLMKKVPADNKKMMRIAVTGGAGSGKSSFCRFLAEQGFCVIDLDVLAREAVRPGMPAYHAIVAAFGPASVGKDGNLDRAWLRDRMIREPEARTRLEAAIHPVVYRLMEAEIARQEEMGAGVVVVEFPLLFETKRESFFDRVIVVFVPPEVQMARLMARDGVDRASAERLIRIQMPLGEKARKADLVFDNSGSLEHMKACILGWMEKGELAAEG